MLEPVGWICVHASAHCRGYIVDINRFEPGPKIAVLGLTAVLENNRDWACSNRHGSKPSKADIKVKVSNARKGYFLHR